ncbi:MAG: hypothetical protein AAFU77_17665 [Myxococcota bacterium]
MIRFITCALIVGLVACNSDEEPMDITANANSNRNNDTPVDDGNNGRTPPEPYDDIAFNCADVIMPDNPERPYGQQGRLLRNSAGDLFYAMLRPIGNQPVCPAAISGAISDTPVLDFLVFVRPVGSNAWNLERVELDGTGDPGVITSRFGIGAAIDPSTDQPTFTVAAGDNGLFTCGSSDLVVITRDSNGEYELTTVADNSGQFPSDGNGVCAAGDDRAEGEKECCEDVTGCTAGDDVGWWSDIAFRGGNEAIVYSDSHNAGTEDGGENQDIELWEPGGISGVRPFSGLGQYAGLTYNTDGDLVVAFTGYVGGGLYVLRRVGNGPEWLGANATASGNQRGNLFPGFIVGERISIATAPDGTVGLAFHAIRDERDFEVQDLYYCESEDGGETFLPCTIVDNPNLRVGNNPSLAYNSLSQPGISYYYCGPDSNCSRDGLRYAWRDEDGLWWYFNVQNSDASRSGEFSGLVFDNNDAPIIVFTDLTRGAAMAAVGTFGTGTTGTCAQ